MVVRNKYIASSDSDYRVRILTRQSAKGLEAETVFIIGLEEGSIPKSDVEDKLAEEARLFFVAMTRAKEQLHLFHCRKRTAAMTFRKNSHGLKMSRFLVCMPSDKVIQQYHPATDSSKK